MNQDQIIDHFIESLPSINKLQIPEDLCCPICLLSFQDIFKDEAHSNGATKLPTCQHLFCRNDLVEWIRSMHGSCPSCRRVFLDIRPPSDSDGESSDGGEYIPDDEDEEEDSFMVYTSDGFSDADALDADMEDVDLDMYQNWEHGNIDEEITDGSSEYGLTDEDSLSNSDISLESEQVSVQSDTNVVIQEFDPEDGEIDNLDLEEENK